jgi:hypothetical protein
MPSLPHHRHRRRHSLLILSPVTLSLLSHFLSTYSTYKMQDMLQVFSGLLLSSHQNNVCCGDMPVGLTLVRHLLQMSFALIAKRG